ncbi:MAG: exopolyphosphatase, partial [Thermodesulfobacteriota bacterium]|nr:exopolyphosphatase [Thermodesulfobacteriota bacterium]
FIDGNEFTVESVSPDPDAPIPETREVEIPEVTKGKTVRAPFGRVFATRSGDKGGNANLGVWAKTPEAFAFLRDFLTTQKLKELLKDMSAFEIERYEMPNLLAINFYIKGVLGEGVAASLRSDPQAKTLGEYLRAKVIELPESLLPNA